jgi:putative ABC transport system substrate-binding protein
MWRIGLLGNVPITDPAAARIYEAFRLALQERGYVEGKNLVVERRFAQGRDERFPALAAELVRLKPDVIVTTTGPGTEAAKAATSTIPIVIAGISDPIGRGLVTSLAHPGGNITGIANLQLDLYSKRVELLKSAIPMVARVVSIGNTASLGKIAANQKEQEADAKAMGVTLVRIELNAPSEWPRVTAAIIHERPDALVLSPAPINFNLRREIAEFATVQRLPAIGANRDQVVAGILMSYGSDSDDVIREAAAYVDKILKGARPGDLPIEQPTKFRLVINMKAAKALGLTIPQSLLMRADEVIH